MTVVAAAGDMIVHLQQYAVNDIFDQGWEKMNDLSLKLSVSNGGKYNFYLHELRLKEGISMLSEATLTLYSKSAVNMEDLKKLISSTATVQITQKNGQESTLSRYFSGTVTGVRHCGAVQKTPGGIVCKYILEIRSPLYSLKFASPRRYCTGKKVGELIREILSDHKITAAVPAEIAEKSHPYYQGNSSDYDFLLRLFAEYGLNYVFKSSSQLLTPPEMCIFTREPQRVSLLEPPPEEEILSFYCGDAREGTPALLSWEMSSVLGVDAVDINYENCGGSNSQNVFSSKDSARKKVFNAAPFGTVEDNEVKNAAEMLLARFESAKNTWEGRTSSITAMPGTAIKVMAFGNGMEPVNALVSFAELEAVAPWPDDLGVAPAAVPRIDIRIRCCDPAFNDKAVITSESDVTAHLCRMLEEFSHTGDTIITGTVCDADGNILPADRTVALEKSDGNDTYTFCAKTENAGVVKVHLTMPLGGSHQGMFRTPRTGERVLLQSNGAGACFLHSYLPNQSSMPFAGNMEPDSRYYNSNEMTVLRHVASGEQVDFEGYLPLDFERTQGAPEKISEFGIYSAGAVTQKEQEGEVGENSGTLVNILSTGKILSAASDNNNISGENVNISTNDNEGTISLVGNSRIVLEAQDSITLKVGFNSIVLNKSGISLRSCKWSNVPGVMDASIYMDGVSGVSIGGMRTFVKGYLGGGIFDSMGGGVQIAAGTAALTGGTVNIATSKGNDVLANGLSLAADTVSQTTSQFTNLHYLLNRDEFPDGASPWSSDKENNATSLADSILASAIFTKDFLHSIWKAGHQIFDGILAYNGFDHKANIGFAIPVLNFIADMINQTWMIVNQWDPQWLDDYVGDEDCKVTRRDAFKLCATTCTFAAWILTLGVMCTKLKWNTSTAIKITAGEIQIKGKSLDTLLAEAIAARNPQAGQ